MSSLFCIIEHRASSRCIHDPTFRHSSLVSSASKICHKEVYIHWNYGSKWWQLVNEDHRTLRKSISFFKFCFVLFFSRKNVHTFSAFLIILRLCTCVLKTWSNVEKNQVRVFPAENQSNYDVLITIINNDIVGEWCIGVKASYFFIYMGSYMLTKISRCRPCVVLR